MLLFTQLLGSIALLLWGLRMVRTGVMRAYGTHLRQMARRSDGKVFPAITTGCIAAALLQSSTATAMIAASFSAQGILGASSAFFTMLGADIGSAIAVLIVSQKLTFMSPLLLIIGVFGFMSTQVSQYRSLFRAFLGLGLILLALSMISGTANAVADQPELKIVMSLFADKPLFMLLLGVGLAYLLHSSLAVVLLAGGFVATSVLTTEAALYVVLGANIGSGLLPVIANWRSKSGGRIPVTANFLIRLTGVVLVFFTVGWLLSEVSVLVSAHLLPAVFHLALNVGVAALGLISSALYLRLSRWLIPDDIVDPTVIEPRFLDPNAVTSPTQALACAKREAMVMANIAQDMVQQSLPVLFDSNRDGHSTIVAMDDSVDRLYDAIKLYIARIVQEPLSEDETVRAFALLSFTANMEHIGDIVDGGLMETAAKKDKLQIQFSHDGMAEIRALHDAVCESFDLAINTFLSDDGELAKQLHSAKAQIRKIERKSVVTHIERIGSGQVESIGTSGLHLDVIRDLKRINGHLTAIAYPVLEATGEIPKTKWKSKRL